MRCLLLRFLVFLALLLTCQFNAGAAVRQNNEFTATEHNGVKVNVIDEGANLTADLTRCIQSPVTKNFLPDSFLPNQAAVSLAANFTLYSFTKARCRSSIKEFYRLLLFPFHIFW
jgi:hypothetical protein